MKTRRETGCFDRVSPALKEILLKFYYSSQERQSVTDYQLNEFGSVQYHVQVNSQDSHHIYLSVSSPLLTQGTFLSHGLSKCISQRSYSNVMEVAETPKTGYPLTIRIDLSKFPQNIENCLKLITSISSLHADIVCSQLKEMLCVTSFKNTSQGMYNKPIKVVLDAKDHFFVITQVSYEKLELLPVKLISRTYMGSDLTSFICRVTKQEKTAVVFPMRFGDDSDVIIATTLFQELVVMGSSKSCAKAPPCTWSPIPPAELRGEYFEDLTTNGGFMSFGTFLVLLILSVVAGNLDVDSWVLTRGVGNVYRCSFAAHKRSKIDKTVWNLSNFQAYVRHYVKCTRGFVQRSLRKRVESLSEMLLNPVLAKQHETSSMKNQGHRRMKIFGRLSKSKLLREKCSGFLKKIMQLRSKIKIHGLNQIRRRWLKLSQCYSSRSYTRLD